MTWIARRKTRWVLAAWLAATGLAAADDGLRALPPHRQRVERPESDAPPVYIPPPSVNELPAADAIKPQPTESSRLAPPRRTQVRAAAMDKHDPSPVAPAVPAGAPSPVPVEPLVPAEAPSPAAALPPIPEVRDLAVPTAPPARLSRPVRVFQPVAAPDAGIPAPPALDALPPIPISSSRDVPPRPQLRPLRSRDVGSP